MVRVGVLITSSAETGGAYQYALEMLGALAAQRGRLDVCVLDYKLSEAARALCAERELRIASVGGALRPNGLLRQAWRGLRRLAPGLATRLRASGAASTALRRALGEVMAGERLEIVVLCEPSPLGFEGGLPFIMPIHDLQHRMQPEWPEVSADGEYESREYLYVNATRAARRILVDSEVGKEDVLRHYEIPAERVKVLPYVGSSVARRRATASEIAAVRAKYGLPERYVFYPAQFWPHKNHVRLAEALHGLDVEHGVRVALVLTGGKKNGYEAFAAAVARLGIGERIHWLGYVPDEEMAALYGGAAALVFPTFFGPTNIPILEAWALGVPVVTSDVRGVREQVGEAARLADPRNAAAMAEQMRAVLTDGGLRERLVRGGAEKIAAYSHEQFAETLCGIVEAAAAELRSAHV